MKPHKTFCHMMVTTVVTVLHLHGSEYSVLHFGQSTHEYGGPYDRMRALETTIQLHGTRIDESEGWRRFCERWLHSRARGARNRHGMQDASTAKTYVPMWWTKPCAYLPPMTARRCLAPHFPP